MKIVNYQARYGTSNKKSFQLRQVTDFYSCVFLFIYGGYEKNFISVKKLCTKLAS